MKMLAACVASFLALSVIADDEDDDSFRSHEDETAEPELALITPEERVKAIRELKRVERRSKKLGIFLNRGKMEKIKGDRLAKVLQSYDRFISILEELPENFVKACRIDSVWFSDEIVDLDGNHAGGVAHGDGIELPFAFGKGTVYHEMFHKFEVNISEQERKRWDECNPDEFIYTGSKWGAFLGNSKQDKKTRERYKKRLASGKEKSAAEQREKLKKKKDIAREAANKTNAVVQAAFMGDYAQTTPGEDRACTFDAMMSMGPAFLDYARRSEHMKKKMEWMIRVTGTGKFLGKGFWEEHSDVTPDLAVYDYSRGIHDWPKAKPEEAGYDSERLALIPRAIARYRLATSAMMVVVGGKVIFEYGDTSAVSDVSSCWPSLLSVLYGKSVHIRRINLDETLADIGISDVGGLERRETQATVRDVVSSRSCCFHPAANEPPGREPVPRGSLLPGHDFTYNDWDFNVAATIFEQKTGRMLAEAFDTDVAQPLHFQDWDRSNFRMTGNLDVSEHLACAISLSTRDMARVGEVMLRKGKWKGLHVVPKSWVEESTRMVSRFTQGGGYGYMWWIEKENQKPAVYKGAFSARGLNAQRITVIPELDMVIAHQTSSVGGRQMKSAEYRKLVYLAVTANKKIQ